MKLLKFINKKYNNNSELFKKLLQKQCPFLKYKNIYFEVDNFTTDQLTIYKCIFKNRYLLVYDKDINFENLFEIYFDIQLIEKLDKDGENNIFVSQIQLLFDKIYYFDFFKDLGIKNYSNY
jgi:hypothetical protein